MVAKDNTVAWEGLHLQLPESRLRPHFVKAKVRVHAHWDGQLGVHLGPHRLASYTAAGVLSAPAAPSVTSCSEPSRRGLASSATEARKPRQPTLTAPARAATGNARAGTEERASSRTKELRPTEKTKQAA